MKKILNNLFHRFKEDSLAKRRGGAERTLGYCELKSVRRVLVVYTVVAGQKAWMKKLSDKFKDVKFDWLCYLPTGTEVVEPANAVVLKNEDLVFGGKIQNEALLALLEREHDLLLDFTAISNGLLNYVLSNSQAKCKIGMKKDGFENDIVIGEVSESEQFIDKMTEILSGIKQF